MTGRLRLIDIPVGEARTTVADGEQVAVFRLRDGTIRALSAVCPHLGGPLADGISDNRVVMCPLHSRTYDLVTGAETAGGPPVRAWSACVDDGGEVHVAPMGD
jgi:nitrite reductase (NADH) small subunit